jgi:hypothetical protein
LFGAAAGGQIPGFSPEEARNKLRGVKEKQLPARTSSSRPAATRAATRRRRKA